MKIIIFILIHHKKLSCKQVFIAFIQVLYQTSLLQSSKNFNLTRLRVFTGLLFTVLKEDLTETVCPSEKNKITNLFKNYAKKLKNNIIMYYIIHIHVCAFENNYTQ